MSVAFRGAKRYSSAEEKMTFAARCSRAIPYLHALRNATRSASSCGVSCWSSPAGMIETALGRISSISLRGTRASWLTPVARTSSSAVLAAEQAVVDLAVAGGDRDRLEAAHQAGAGKDDGLQQVALGSDRADAGEVGADVSARDSRWRGRRSRRPSRCGRRAGPGERHPPTA